MEIGTDEDPRHFHEELGDNVGTRLNWLRAAVLGANDGIVSTAGVVMGVAGATADRARDPDRRRRRAVAGALSMARRRVRLGQHPARLRAGAARAGAPRAAPRSPRRSWPSWPAIYVGKGLTPELARAGRRAS